MFPKMTFLKLRYLVFILFSSLLSSTATGQLDTAFHFEIHYRIKYLDSILLRTLLKGNNSEIVAALINIQALAIQHHDKETELVGKIFQERAKTIKDSAELKLVLEKIEQYIFEARQNKFISVEIVGLEHAGAIANKEGNLPVALSYYIRAYKLFNKLPLNLVPKVPIISHQLAKAYFSFGDYKKALEFIPANKFNKNNEPHFYMLLMDLISQIYFNLNEMDSSMYYIKEAENVFLSTDTSKAPFKGWDGIFSGNRAKIYFQWKQFDKVIPLAKMAIEKTASVNQNNNAASFSILLAKTYIELNEYSKAAELLPGIRDYLENLIEPSLKIEYYKLVIALDVQHSNPNKKLRYFDSIQYWSKIQTDNFSKNTQNQVELQNKILEAKILEEKLNQKISNQLYYRKILWILLGLILIIAFIIINRKEFQLRLQQIKIEEVKEEAEKELLQARIQLQDFTRTLSEKTILLEQMESDKNISQQQELVSLRENAILTEADWLKFRQLFDSVHINYLDRLNEKFPNLTAGEIRLFVLLKLKLNTSEIALILGVSNGAIRTMRSRLLKKINISSEENLEDIAQSI